MNDSPIFAKKSTVTLPFLQKQ